MTKQELQNEIEEIIIGYQNDINEYFKCDVPLENNAIDIDYKLDKMRLEVIDLISSLK
jgi:hypothetical protein